MLPFGDFTVVGNVPQCLIGVSLLGAGCAASWALRRPTLGLLRTVAVGTRHALLFMHPGAGFWRYVWEGHVTLAGFNPHQLAPKAAEREHLRDAVVWPHVGHPTLTRVWFAPHGDARRWRFGFKFVFALADLAMGTLLLKRFGRNTVLTYLWNPLVIYFFAGGGYYDSLFILPLVGARQLGCSIAI